MDPTLEPYIKKLLDGGMKTAEDVAKFIEVQTPELGKEIITWGAASEMVAPIFGLILIAVSIWFHLNNQEKEWYCKGVYGEPPVIIFNTIAFLVGFVVFLVEMMDVLYPLVAPRLYILEKISSFVK
jgi:uncharacterized protein with PQ loop repeat